VTISFYIFSVEDLGESIAMTTKPSLPVQEFSPDSLEKLAYRIAAEIPVLEPHDADRLGYCLWAWLHERRGSLAQAIHGAGVRSALTEKEIIQNVAQKFHEKGISVS